MASLPKSLDYSEKIASLPEGATSNLITCRPVSGATFNDSSIIDVDIPCRGFMDCSSLSIRYTATITTVAGDTTHATALCGCPLYAPFQKLSTTVNGSQIDNILNYNMVQNVLVNGSMDVATKYGFQSAFGYTNGVIATPATPTGTMIQLDSRLTATTVGVVSDVYSVSGPLPCLISNCEKALPLFMFGSMRLSFTLDTLANMFYTAGNTSYVAPAAFQIKNFEVVYNCMDMTPAVEHMVRGIGKQLFLKSHSYNNSGINVGSGANGSNSYVFNQRLSSIRSAFIIPTLTVGSKWAEIVDVSCGGDYQLQVGNVCYPSLPLSFKLNSSGVLNETRRAFDNLYSYSGMSISTSEFGLTALLTATNTNPLEPGKAIIGVNLERCQSSDHVLLSGISTYQSPINVIINYGATTSNACNLNLLLDYDAILVIDTESNSLSVRN